MIGGLVDRVHRELHDAHTSGTAKAQASGNDVAACTIVDIPVF